MGINRNTARIEKEVMKSSGLKYDDSNICELGNQWLTFQRKTGKEYYFSLGAKKHISIDLNGKDGSLPLNLDSPLPYKFRERFDLVTNYGTIEHVNNQYQAFKNVHDICKKSGVMIHIMPKIGSMKRHGRYYYTKQFYEELAKNCGYKIVRINCYDDGVNAEIRTNKAIVVYGAFLKINQDKFISENVFNNLKGIKDTEDLKNTGNYEATLRYKIRRLWNLSFRILTNPKRSYNKIKQRIEHKTEG